MKTGINESISGLIWSCAHISFRPSLQTVRFTQPISLCVPIILPFLVYLEVFLWGVQTSYYKKSKKLIRITTSEEHLFLTLLITSKLHILKWMFVFSVSNWFIFENNWCLLRFLSVFLNRRAHKLSRGMGW